jgi:polyhydroxybutyrate depolymerase
MWLSWRSCSIEVASVVNVDRKRVYATGISNGGMMCYRVAAELSGRIAAIAPVSGTMAIEHYKLQRPVPVMHFHGTADRQVPWDGVSKDMNWFLELKSVEETIRLCVKANGCPEIPVITQEPNKADDGTSVERKTYGPGKDGAEVVLLTIKGGGHTWPGREPLVEFLGKSTHQISANDLMWEFFKRHPME